MLAFVFPGQGAQVVGMGKDFYENSMVSRDIYETATKLLGIDMKQLCFEENDNIHITEYTQAALLTTSTAMLNVLEENGIRPDVCAGLSLGEYSAMVAAGVMSFEDAVKTVRQRGILMQEAVPAGLGAMSAIIGLDTEVIQSICDAIDGVQIANYNCPGQIVISGKVEAVQEANTKLAEAGARRTILLNVSGPFHSDMLKEAGKKLGSVLETVELQENHLPYVSNVTSEYVTGTSNIKDLLVKQVYSSVKWQQSVEQMIENGVDTFVEIGPNKTLTGFIRKINKNVKVYNIEKYDDIEKVVNALKGE